MRLNFHLNYFLALSIFAASMPLSPFLLSVSQFILVGNWLLEGNFRNKLQMFKERKGLWLFLLIFLLHIVGMIYTSDIPAGLQDLKIKLPLLILPLVIGTSRPLTEKAINRILIIFGIATFISTLVCFYNYTRAPLNDLREISVFISHIRLSILINIAVFCFAYLIMKYNHITWVGYKIGGILIIAWLIFFLHLMQSITGIIVFFTLLVLISAHLHRLVQSTITKTIILSFTGLLIVYLAANLVISIHLFKERPEKFQNLEPVTMKGNPYAHLIENKEMEGGNYVWLYVSEKELEEAWNSISGLDYEGKDKKGQELKFTLIRYLTSSGLRKDSAGVSKLSKKEIEQIESGIASKYYSEKIFPHPRIYQIIWELDSYFKGANPNGLSIGQRIEYWKNAIQIIRNNPIAGVGTGDVQEAFNIQYERSNSPLEQKYRLRAHNQFLTFAIALGIPAMLLMIFALVYPVFAEKRWKLFLSQLIIFTIFVSMLNEDTLETQAGVSFFAFFYCLFIFINEDPARD